MCHQLQGDLEEKAVAINKLTEANSDLKYKYADLIRLHSKCDSKIKDRESIVKSLKKENEGLKKRSYS